MNFLYLVPLFACAVFGIPVTYDQRQDGDVNVRADLQNFVIVALVPKIGSGGASSALLDAISNSLASRKELKNLGNGKNNRDPEEPDEEAPDARTAGVFAKDKPYHVDISRSEPNPQLRSAEAKRGGRPSPKSPDGAVDSPIPDVLLVKDNQYVIEDRNGREINIVAEVSEDDEPLTLIDDNDTNEAPVEPARGEGAATSRRDSGLLLLGAMEQCGPDSYRDEQGICRDA